MPKLKPGTIIPTDDEVIISTVKPDHISQEDWDSIDSPELTAEWFARARPAREVLPELIGAEAAAELLRPRGRPVKPDRKVDVKLRIDPDVVQRLREGGKGWQTRANAILRKGVGL